MNLKLSRILAFGIFCVLVVCGSRAASADPSNPCSLLTQDQVSTALGAKVDPGKRTVPKLCEWDVQGSSGLNAAKLVVTMLTPQGFAGAKAVIGHGITKTPVSGIGDEAVYGTTSNYATVLTVKKGDVYFSVHIYGNKNDEDVKTKEKTLALEIIKNL